MKTTAKLSSNAARVGARMHAGLPSKCSRANGRRDAWRPLGQRVVTTGMEFSRRERRGGCGAGGCDTAIYSSSTFRFPHFLEFISFICEIYDAKAHAKHYTPAQNEESD